MYIYWLLAFVCTPILVLWWFKFKLLYKYKATLLLSMLSALLFSIPWDIYAVKTAIWSFPEEGNLGILIGDLPIEEFLFIILVTLFIASITIIVKYHFKKQ